jgi:beta-glucanase (GH16 family)
MLNISSSLFLSLLVLTNAGIGLIHKSTELLDSVPTKYKLVWSDEFNRNGKPDSRNWSFETGFVRNHEDQWYQQENANCKDGMLIIEARRTQFKNPDYARESSDWKKNRQNIIYTSSSINTAGKQAWQYGRFVMRARIDTNAGMWPAFWTLGVQGKWPANGEIDIMEYYRGKILANIACASSKASKPEWFSNTKAVSTFKEKEWAKKFHIWRMDWDVDAISLYVDNTLLNKVELSKLKNKDGSNINPFRHPHYLLLNLAVGGDSGGQPGKTVFPRRFEVDYVRVYQNLALKHR